VGSRTGLDAVANRKIPALAGSQTPVVRPVVHCPTKTKAAVSLEH